jgi:hypothetical protein
MSYTPVLALVVHINIRSSSFTVSDISATGRLLDPIFLGHSIGSIANPPSQSSPQTTPPNQRLLYIREPPVRYGPWLLLHLDDRNEAEKSPGARKCLWVPRSRGGFSYGTEACREVSASSCKPHSTSPVIIQMLTRAIFAGGLCRHINLYLLDLSV